MIITIPNSLNAFNIHQITDSINQMKLILPSLPSKARYLKLRKQYWSYSEQQHGATCPPEIILFNLKYIKLKCTINLTAPRMFTMREAQIHDNFIDCWRLAGLSLSEKCLNLFLPSVYILTFVYSFHSNYILSISCLVFK